MRGSMLLGSNVINKIQLGSCGDGGALLYPEAEIPPDAVIVRPYYAGWPIGESFIDTTSLEFNRVLQGPYYIPLAQHVNVDATGHRVYKTITDASKPSVTFQVSRGSSYDGTNVWANILPDDISLHIDYTFSTDYTHLYESSGTAYTISYNVWGSTFPNVTDTDYPRTLSVADILNNPHSSVNVGLANGFTPYSLIGDKFKYDVSYPQVVSDQVGLKNAFVTVSGPKFGANWSNDVWQDSILSEWQPSQAWIDSKTMSTPSPIKPSLLPWLSDVVTVDIPNYVYANQTLHPYTSAHKTLDVRLFAGYWLEVTPIFKQVGELIMTKDDIENLTSIEVIYSDENAEYFSVPVYAYRSTLSGSASAYDKYQSVKMYNTNANLRLEYNFSVTNHVGSIAPKLIWGVATIDGVLANQYKVEYRMYQAAPASPLLMLDTSWVEIYNGNNLTCDLPVIPNSGGQLTVDFRVSASDTLADKTSMPSYTRAKAIDYTLTRFRLTGFGAPTLTFPGNVEARISSGEKDGLFDVREILWQYSLDGGSTWLGPQSKGIDDAMIVGYSSQYTEYRFRFMVIYTDGQMSDWSVVGVIHPSQHLGKDPTPYFVDTYDAVLGFSLNFDQSLVFGVESYRYLIKKTGPNTNDNPWYVLAGSNVLDGTPMHIDVDYLHGLDGDLDICLDITYTDGYQSQWSYLLSFYVEPAVYDSTIPDSATFTDMDGEFTWSFNLEFDEPTFDSGYGHFLFGTLSDDIDLLDLELIVAHSPYDISYDWGTNIPDSNFVSSIMGLNYDSYTLGNSGLDDVTSWRSHYPDPNYAVTGKWLNTYYTRFDPHSDGSQVNVYAMLRRISNGKYGKIMVTQVNFQRYLDEEAAAGGDGDGGEI